MAAEPKISMILLTKIMNQEIRFHWRRVQLPVWQVLQQIEHKPDDLTTSEVNDWIGYRAKFVNENHWQLVIELMKKLEDAPNGLGGHKKPYRNVGHPNNILGTKRLPVTDEMHAHFLSELKRTDADIKLDLVDYEDAPEGLNYRVILILKLKEAKTIRDDYWEFIIKRLSEMPDFHGRGDY